MKKKAKFRLKDKVFITFPSVEKFTKPYGGVTYYRVRGNIKSKHWLGDSWYYGLTIFRQDIKKQSPKDRIALRQINKSKDLVFAEKSILLRLK